MLIGSLSVCLFVSLCVIVSTRGWKQSRRRRTFPVTRSPGHKQGTLCTLKDVFFGKFDPLMNETFLECETICRELPPGQVFVDSLAKIDPRKVVEVVRLTRHKKTPLRPIFRALSETDCAILL